MAMISLQDFLKIGDRIREKWGRKFYNHIDFCGLEPVMEPYRYESTPVNSVTFATTGGNGVHFGLLTGVNDFNGQQPVVMTVPMVMRNIVLADTLDEFFGLGFYNGWFPFEQLVYSFDETIEYYSCQDESLSIEQSNFLALIHHELKITYAPLTRERLDMLATQYNDKVIIQTRST